MSPRAGIAVVGAVTVSLETALGTAVLVAGGPARIALYLFVCAAVTGAMVAALWKLLGVPPRGSGGGEGGSAPDDPPPPPWWPEFERDFRRHVRERDRVRSD